MKLLKLALITLGMFAFTQATAQHTEGKSHTKAFAKMDTNSDNAVSLDEYKAFRVAQAARRAAKGKGQGKVKKEKDPAKKFNKIDTNSDGMIQLAEFNAHKAKMKARKAKRKGAGRGGNG